MMAKTPPPDNYVPLSAAVDDRECEAHRDDCHKQMADERKDCRNRMYWILGVLCGICITFCGAVWVRTEAVNAALIRTREERLEQIGQLRIEDAKSIADREALNRAVQEIKALISGMTAEIKALAKEIREEKK